MCVCHYVSNFQGSRLSSAPYSRAAGGERLARRENELAWFRGQIVILFKCPYAIGFDGISSLFLAKLTNDVPREHPDTFPQEILRVPATKHSAFDAASPPTKTKTTPKIC
jgi:hypothetical protein